MNNFLFGRGGRRRPGFGYYETIGGGAGAGPGFDGASSAVHTHMTNTRLTDPEILETRYPCACANGRSGSGSGGAGAQRGGDGMVREIEFLAALDVSLLTSRRAPAPAGADGGQPAEPGRNRLRRAGEARFLPTCRRPGGSGWGRATCCVSKRPAAAAGAPGPAPPERGK